MAACTRTRTPDMAWGTPAGVGLPCLGQPLCPACGAAASPASARGRRACGQRPANELPDLDACTPEVTQPAQADSSAAGCTTGGQAAARQLQEDARSPGGAHWSPPAWPWTACWRQRPGLRPAAERAGAAGPGWAPAACRPSHTGARTRMQAQRCKPRQQWRQRPRQQQQQQAAAAAAAAAAGGGGGGGGLASGAQGRGPAWVASADWVMLSRCCQRRRRCRSLSPVMCARAPSFSSMAASLSSCAWKCPSGSSFGPQRLQA